MREYFSKNLEYETQDNNYFRQVVFTGRYCQLVLMCLKPGEEIGSEVHNNVDQFFRFEKGEGKVVIDGSEYDVANGSAAVVPAGSEHNVINTGSGDLKLYTIYSPAEHKDGTVHRTKEEADAAHH